MKVRSSVTLTAAHLTRMTLLARAVALTATVGLVTLTTGSFSTVANATTTGARGEPVAIAAKRMRLVETAQLRLTGEGDSTLSESGRATGTFDAPVRAHLTLSVGHVSAVFVLYPKGGTVTGKAEARFTVKGSIAYYGGTLKITRGTGVYRHASGSNIGISGTINHLNFSLTVKANGWISL